MQEHSGLQIDAVIRIPNILLPRGDFESRLGIALDRFEPSQRGPGHYGQLNAGTEGGWPALVGVLDLIGPALRDGVTRAVIGTPEIDLGWKIGVAFAASSLRIPPAVTSAIAKFGFDLVVSAYLTE